MGTDPASVELKRRGYNLRRKAPADLQGRLLIVRPRVVSTWDSEFHYRP